MSEQISVETEKILASFEDEADAWDGMDDYSILEHGLERLGGLLDADIARLTQELEGAKRAVVKTLKWDWVDPHGLIQIDEDCLFRIDTNESGVTLKMLYGEPEMGVDSTELGTMDEAKECAQKVFYDLATKR